MKLIYSLHSPDENFIMNDEYCEIDQQTMCHSYATLSMEFIDLKVDTMLSNSKGPMPYLVS